MQFTRIFHDRSNGKPRSSVRSASACLMLSLIVALCALIPEPSMSKPLSSDHSDPRNRASFHVETIREIANDWATARLSVVAEGKEAAAVADEVNTTMAKAIKQSKRVKQVEVQSGSYTTHPVYDNGRIVRWRASQELRLESGNVDRLAKLIGELQSKSVMLSNIQFSVRRETREALEDEMIEESLGAFRKRADLISKGMGAKGWALIDVNVGTTSGSQPNYRMQRMESDMMSKSAAAPAFEAGTSELRVQASGVIELD